MTLNYYHQAKVKKLTNNQVLIKINNRFNKFASNINLKFKVYKLLFKNK